jgi:hypothetical protein
VELQQLTDAEHAALVVVLNNQAGPVSSIKHAKLITQESECHHSQRQAGPCGLTSTMQSQYQVRHR